MRLLLSMGFRPFFLFTALHGLLAMVAWSLWLGLQEAGVSLTPSFSAPPHLWHAHEMLFGFVAAAVAGFLLTAVPNWAGHPPVRGGRLGLLAGVWLAARAASWLSAWLTGPVLAWLPVLLDALFLPLLLGLLAPALRKAGKRNLVVPPLLLAFAAGTLLSALEVFGLWDAGGAMGRQLAIDVVAVLLTLIGGRVTPAFSRNWLAARGLPADVMPPAWVDRAAMLSAVAVLLAGLAPLPDWVVGAAAAVAAGAAAVRLAYWKGWRVRGDALLWMLHLGMAWLAVGFALRAAAGLGDVLPPVLAVHAQMAGAAATMILAVAGRASLGHTGRPLVAPRALITAVLLLGLAAAARVAGPWLSVTVWPELYLPSLVVAAGAWMAAFGLFLRVYWPILLGPRLEQV